MATIGEEIKKYREKKGLSQADLVAKAGIDASILSRLESGGIKTTSEDKIRKVAKALGIPAKKLLRHVTKEPQIETENTFLQIGFGHCIWAAPIIALTMQGRIPNLRVTSYGYMQSDIEAPSFKPYWYDTDELKRDRKIKAGPSYVNCSDLEELPKIENWESEDKGPYLKTFTADDLVNLLLTDEADCIIVPGELFKLYSSLLVRCAYIMNTGRSGCSLMAIGNGLNKEADDFDILFKNVQAVTNGPQITTFFARGTIAERHLEFYLDGYRKDLREFYVDLGDWESFWSQLKEILTKEGGLFFIGWEPQMSWIRKAVHEFNPEFTCVDVELPEVISRDKLPNKREQYLTFEIMFKKTSRILENLETNTALKNFFALLNASIAEISSVTNKNSPIVRLLAKYLDMNSEVCFNALSSLNFALRFYPDWIEYLQKD
jgi:transcriptional regulator with XRE-family HTH domain